MYMYVVVRLSFPLQNPRDRLTVLSSARTTILQGQNIVGTHGISSVSDRNPVGSDDGVRTANCIQQGGGGGRCMKKREIILLYYRIK